MAASDKAYDGAYDLLVNSFSTGLEPDEQDGQDPYRTDPFDRPDTAYEVPEPQDEDYDDDYDGSVESDGSDEGPGPDEEAEALGDLYASQYD